MVVTVAAATPRKLVVACPPECSLHPDKIGEAASRALLAAREKGLGAVLFAREAEGLLGRRVPTSNVSRHLKHYREPAPEDIPDVEPGKPVGDLALLDAIIAAGARNSKAWKPTIKDTLDAMKLKMQLTGNSAFEDMLSMMDSALDLADEVPEAREALGTADEVPAEEELPEPLVG